MKNLDLLKNIFVAIIVPLIFIAAVIIWFWAIIQFTFRPGWKTGGPEVQLMINRDMALISIGVYVGTTLLLMPIIYFFRSSQFAIRYTALLWIIANIAFFTMLGPSMFHTLIGLLR